jgi:VanZ family protein
MTNRFKVFLSLTCLYAILIFYLSSISSLGDPKVIFDFLPLEYIKTLLESLKNSDLRFLLYPVYIFAKYPDKIEHVILYGGFGFLLYFTLNNSLNLSIKKYIFVFAIIIGTIYGASDEFHQYFVPGRSASALDLVADGIGVTLAQTVIFTKGKLCLLKNSSKGFIKRIQYK